MRKKSYLRLQVLLHFLHPNTGFSRQLLHRHDDVQQIVKRWYRSRKRRYRELTVLSRCLSYCSLQYWNSRCNYQKPKQVRIGWYQFHHRPIVRMHHGPNTSGRRCQVWRMRCDCSHQPQRLFGPYRGRLILVNFDSWRFHHRLLVRIGPIPNTSGRRSQGQHRHCFLLLLQRPFDPCRGRLMLVNIDSWCFRCPIARRYSSPSTSVQSCQGQRRSLTPRQKLQQQSAPCQDQSLQMEGRWCRYCFRPLTVQHGSVPSTSDRRCQG